MSHADSSLEHESGEETSPCSRNRSVKNAKAKLQQIKEAAQNHSENFPFALFTVHMGLNTTAMKQIAEVLLLCSIFVATDCLAASSKKPYQIVMSALNYIADFGHRTHPSVGIALVPFALEEEIVPFFQCHYTYPRGWPLAWSLPIEENVDPFEPLFKKLNNTFNNTNDDSDYAHPRWCLLRNFTDLIDLNGEASALQNTWMLPNIINGAVIKKINRSGDGNEYSVLYTRFSAKDFVAVHRIENDKIAPLTEVILFNNVTKLRTAYEAMQKTRRFMLMVYSPLIGTNYLEDTGNFISETMTDQLAFGAYLCMHKPVKDYCDTSELYVLHDETLERCIRCKSNTFLRNCQSERNECMNRNEILPVKSYYVDCDRGEIMMEHENITPLFNYCTENSTCINTHGSYMCLCDDGWIGHYCEIDVDECEESSSKCNERFSFCINTPGSYHCNCIEGYTGEFCDTKISGAVRFQVTYGVTFGIVALITYLTFCSTLGQAQD
uniref:EGF-like domain-containing protein n=1 Tax=Trichuris muris TaxID=70415 RepID=A0A5S6QL93_TRIMR